MDHPAPLRQIYNDRWLQCEAVAEAKPQEAWHLDISELWDSSEVATQYIIPYASRRTFLENLRHAYFGSDLGAQVPSQEMYRDFIGE